MAEPLPDPAPETGHDASSGDVRGEPTGMPRWVKVFAIIALVVGVLLVIILLTGGPGEHGPSRHQSSGLESVAPPGSITEHPAQLP